MKSQNHVLYFRIVLRGDLMIIEHNTELELDYFVGRQAELFDFANYFMKHLKEKSIHHVYGIGGVGKTSLLHQLRQFTQMKQALFIHMDSRDFIHTPQAFIGHLTELLRDSGVMMPSNRDGSSPFKTCIHTLVKLGQSQPVILAFDSYERLDDLDYWLREKFVMSIYHHVHIVIASRSKFHAEWIASPTLRNLIRIIPLENLTLEEAKTYLHKFKITKESDVKILWDFTRGHPLTLSLATEASLAQLNDFSKVNQYQLFQELTKHWLTELKDEQMRITVECASVMRFFNQEGLEYVLGKSVTTDQFRTLIRLTFVKKAEQGWTLNELIRDVIQRDLRERTPDQYVTYMKRCVSYYYKQINRLPEKKYQTSEALEALYQLMYYSSDPLLRAMYYHPSEQEQNTLEFLNLESIKQLEAYCKAKQGNITKYDYHMLDHESGAIYKEESIAQIEKNDFSLFALYEIHQLFPDAIRVLKNKEGEVKGVSVVLPISAQTIEYLQSAPLSGPFFNQISEELRCEIQNSDEVAGWYFRMMYSERSDHALRTVIMKHFLSYISKGGLLVVPTTESPLEAVLQLLGLEKIPTLIQYDLGEEAPIYTYLLDLRGGGLRKYLDVMLEKHVPSLKILCNDFSFTNQEQAVAEALMEGKTNKEIAVKLFITEITVKKHLSSMFQKTGTKNRTSLLKRLME